MPLDTLLQSPLKNTSKFPMQFRVLQGILSRRRTLILKLRRVVEGELLELLFQVFVFVIPIENVAQQRVVVFVLVLGLGLRVIHRTAALCVGVVVVVFALALALHPCGRLPLAGGVSLVRERYDCFHRRVQLEGLV